MDNDQFLYSLETAVFTSSDNTESECSAARRPYHSSSLQEGDLGDGNSGHSGRWGYGGALYPPLPPGSPVVGFAYLGLGGLREEEEEIPGISHKLSELQSRDGE